MASAHSTQTAHGGIRFSADFTANIPRYQREIRRHRLMRWARERSLDDDLLQLALLDLARVDVRYDPARAATPHDFRLAVLGSRVSDCARALMRMHREVASHAESDIDSDGDDGSTETDTRNEGSERNSDNPVLDSVIHGQLVAHVESAIQTLPSRQRHVIELAAEEFTDKEIAERLGVSVQAVNKTRLAAIANLKRAARAQHQSN